MVDGGWCMGGYVYRDRSRIVELGWCQDQKGSDRGAFDGDGRLLWRAERVGPGHSQAFDWGIRSAVKSTAAAHALPARAESAGDHAGWRSQGHQLHPNHAQAHPGGRTVQIPPPAQNTFYGALWMEGRVICPYIITYYSTIAAATSVSAHIPSSRTHRLVVGWCCRAGNAEMVSCKCHAGCWLCGWLQRWVGALQHPHTATGRSS